MFYDTVKDYRLQKFFKAKINALPNMKDRYILRNYAHCGHRINDEIAGVSIIANKKSAKVVGVSMCNNAWACPICSAIKMSKYASRIACAIDALKKEYVPIMVTFTIFHSKNDSCEQAFELLYKTWEKFRSDKHTKKKKCGVFGRFLLDCNIKHYVRCTEVTYSLNGWHPHIHSLFFVPRDKLKLAAEYEIKLRETWRAHQEKAMKLIYGKVKDISLYMSDTGNFSNSVGVYFSKDDEGNLIEQKSSDYLCGWGADSEVTGNYRKEATSKTSRTPYQLLSDWKEKNDEQAGEKFLEFAKYVVKWKRRRADFSRSGINAIVQNYKNSEGYKEVLKKKATEIADAAGEWKLVAWFSRDLWLEICDKNLMSDIIILSLEKDGFYLIVDFLKKNNFTEFPLNYDPIGYSDLVINAFNVA